MQNIVNLNKSIYNLGFLLYKPETMHKDLTEEGTRVSVFVSKGKHRSTP